MKIAIGCDHVAFAAKEIIQKHLENHGHEVIDCGCYTDSRTHYPIYGRAVGLMLADHHATFGVVICGTGVGITNAANRVKDARCCLVNDELSAKWARQKYNANIIGFGALVTGIGLMKTCINSFIHTTFNDKFEEYQKILDDLMSKNNTAVNFFEKEIDAWEKGIYTDGEKQPKIELPRVKF